MNDHIHTTKPNALINEQSPYLLQHAYNPVEWMPWGQEAFERAAREDKPLFVSIGYATCHWCHVMERESFEDKEIAALLNNDYIPVKVDREERPDIDAVYMACCQAATGHGGWPLSVFLTPDKKPFFVGTYFPKMNKYNRPGFTTILENITEAWKTQRDNIEASANNLIVSLSARNAPSALALPPDIETQAAEMYRRAFDSKEGGFSEKPKFPAPHNLLFLIEYAARTGENTPSTMAIETLFGIRCGGIYDHIGGGIHRYSTDKRWLLPHFEKMLYDQAGAVLAFTAAALRHDIPLFEETVFDICDYVLRDMTSPEGMFFSAEDADSEGVEGKFYVWEQDELHSLLGTKAAALCQDYNARPEGNYHDEATGELMGDNILHITKPAFADSQNGEDTRRLIARHEEQRRILFEERAKRIRPLLDDKVLTDWNGFMIAALTRAGSAFGGEDYVAAAERAFEQLLSCLRRSDGRILHRYRNGNADIAGFLDDYAYLALAAIELYTATAKSSYLPHLFSIVDEMLRLFGTEAGALSFSADDNEKLPLSNKEAYDGAYPSGNSVGAYVLAYCAALTDNETYSKRASDIIAYFADAVRRYPTGFAFLLRAQALLNHTGSQIIIAGNVDDDEMQQLRATLYKQWLPGSVIAFQDNSDTTREYLPLVAQNPFPQKGFTLYICENFACQAPITSLEEAVMSLRSRSSANNSTL